MASASSPSPSSFPESEMPPSMPKVIVGVGTSAGGLEALQKLLKNLPAIPNAAIVVVQHLSPDHKSLMVELLQRHTEWIVEEIIDGGLVKEGHIYVLPGHATLTIRKGRLYLIEKSTSGRTYYPIDTFLHALAEDKSHRAIGVILSGTGSDGSNGITSIKQSGGFVLVQDIRTSRFDGMPSAALATGMVDGVLIPEDMGRVISHLVEDWDSTTDLDMIHVSEEEQVLDKILKFVFARTQMEFAAYKEGTLHRRIDKRMQETNSATLEEYLAYLQAHPLEAKTLVSYMLIRVTNFFRNEEAFEALEQDIWPPLFEQVASGKDLRVWVAGCSTGQEAISLLISLTRYRNAHNLNHSIKVFATDIDAEAIGIAGRAEYTWEQLNGIPKADLDLFFDQKGTVLSLKKDYRRNIIYAVHNLLMDPPIHKVDLVTCRNVLIYFKPLYQNRILATLLFALNEKGYFFMGKSETVGRMSDFFEEIDAKWKLYRKSKPFSIHDPRLSLARSLTRRPQLSTPKTYSGMASQLSAKTPVDDFKSMLLDTYSPMAAFVDEQFIIQYISGGLNRFLKLPSGSQDLSILEMVPDSLLTPIKTGVRLTFQNQNGHVIKDVFMVIDDDVETAFQLRFRYLHKNTWPFPVVMLVWEPVSIEPAAPTAPDLTLNVADALRNLQLEQRLLQTEENLQVANEELETSKEEYQASHEELMASNEELQSTNEELQSLNEELFTVNSELQSKITELSELTQDMDNLLANTQIGTLFLDRNLIIRKFTGVAKVLFDLIPSDIGRPITHFNPRLLDVDIIEAFNKVRESGEVFLGYVKSLDKANYLLRILPYYPKSGFRDGVVCTIIPMEMDVLTLDENRFTRILLDVISGEKEPSAIKLGSFIIADALAEDCPIIFLNKAFEELTGYGLGEVKGKNCRFLQGPGTDKTTTARIRQAIQEGTKFEGELLNYRKDGTPFMNLLRIFPIRDVDKRVIFFIAFQREIPFSSEDNAERLEAEKQKQLSKIPLPSAFVNDNQMVILGNEKMNELGIKELNYPSHVSDLQVQFKKDDEKKAEQASAYSKGQSQFFSVEIGSHEATLQINPQFDVHNLLEGWIWTFYIKD